MPYETEAQAIEIANDSEFGLAAYVQSEDLERARRVGRLMRAGTVYLNHPAFDIGAPFGGYKKSGNGRNGPILALTISSKSRGLPDTNAPSIAASVIARLDRAADRLREPW